jgi:hypothetical protein
MLGKHSIAEPHFKPLDVCERKKVVSNIEEGSRHPRSVDTNLRKPYLRNYSLEPAVVANAL